MSSLTRIVLNDCLLVPRFCNLLFLGVCVCVFVLCFPSLFHWLCWHGQWHGCGRLHAVFNFPYAWLALVSVLENYFYLYNPRLHIHVYRCIIGYLYVYLLCVLNNVNCYCFCVVRLLYCGFILLALLPYFFARAGVQERKAALISPSPSKTKLTLIH